MNPIDSTNRRFAPLRAASVVLALLALTATATAKEAKKTAFAAEVTGTLIYRQGDYDVFALDGAATGLGDVTGDTLNHSPGDGSHEDGVFFLRDARGDTIFFAYRVVLDADGDELKGPYTVEGGTGRFAGARGGGTLVIGFTDVQGVVTVTLKGDLSN